MHAVAPTSGPRGRLGVYELLREIGRGGFATVWLARAIDGPRSGELVAVKALHQATSDPRMERMLRTEGRIASRIEHPNVATMFELDEDEGTLYLVMEYVEGASLSTLARLARERDEPLPTDFVVAVLMEVASGLHAAHEIRESGELVGVVHRDVSPQNILVGPGGAVKLIDFGVAKARALAETETTEGVAKGKLRYMAPEQILGEELDRRVDVWALGAVGYELVEGRRVHDGPNEFARLHSLLHNAHPEPLSGRAPPALASVLLKALSRDRTERYESALALREALASTVDGPISRETIARTYARLVLGQHDHSLVEVNVEATARTERTSSASIPPPRRVPLRTALIGGSLLFAVGAVLVMAISPETDVAPAAAVGPTDETVVPLSGAAAASEPPMAQTLLEAPPAIVELDPADDVRSSPPPPKKTTAAPRNKRDGASSRPRAPAKKHDIDDQIY